MSKVGFLNNKRLLTVMLPTIAVDFILVYTFLDRFRNWNFGSILGVKSQELTMDLILILFAPVIIDLILGIIAVWVIEKNVIFTKFLIIRLGVFLIISMQVWTRLFFYEDTVFPGEGMQIFLIYFLFGCFFIVTDIVLLILVYKIKPKVAIKKDVAE